LDDSVLDMNLAIAGFWILAEDESFAAPARRILQPIVDAILSDENVAAAEPTYQQILASVELQSVKDRAITELAIETLGPIMERLPDMLITEPDQIRDLAVLRGRLLDLTISDLFLTILSTAGTAPLRRMFTESLDHAVAAYQHVIRFTLQERMERLGVMTLPVAPPIPTPPAPNRDETTALLTPDEAARRLRVSKVTLWRLVRDGVITKTYIRGAVRYDPNDLDRYIGRS
jgi:excisionase family DNA binding protein